MAPGLVIIEIVIRQKTGAGHSCLAPGLRPDGDRCDAPPLAEVKHALTFNTKQEGRAPRLDF